MSQTMIDEDRLVHLFEQLAAEIPIPLDGVETILAVRDQEDERSAERRPRPRYPYLIIAAAAVAAVLVGWVLVGAHHGRSPDPVAQISNGLGDASATQSQSQASRKAFAPTQAAGDTLAGGAGVAAGAAPAAPNASAASPPQAAGATNAGSAVGVPAPSARVVKTGMIDLEIAKGEFADVTTRLTALVSGNGGFVAASTTNESSDSPSGSLTLRVPAASFEDTVTKVRALGKVVQSSAKGEDVTAQFVDLDARIRSLQATRQQYVTLLSRASNIGDILNVQQHISDLQTQIEQLQGQQKLLADQSDLATLEVHLGAAGAAPRAVAATKPKSGMAKAWDRAVSRFVGGVEGVVAASGTLAFVLVLAGAALILWRLASPAVRRRRL